jgi:hypothetical protein
MSKKIGKVTNLWTTARRQVSVNKLAEARDTLDKCLLALAEATDEGIEVIDNVKVDLWKDRVWLLLEEKGLLL